MGRRQARETAMTILYCHEERGGQLPPVLDEFLDSRANPPEDQAFVRALVNTTIEHQEDIDRQIIQVLKNWEYQRVSLVDKIILRVGACEILYFDDIPFQVAINEAIEIGKKFGGEDSGKFINGILDAIAAAAGKVRTNA